MKSTNGFVNSPPRAARARHWERSSLSSPYSVGYVYLPALFGIAAASVLTAPLGVKLAHSLPVDKLKRIFALLLLVVATKMLVSAL
jgi:uncharacterized membrane protein YfcA